MIGQAFSQALSDFISRILPCIAYADDLLKIVGFKHWDPETILQYAEGLIYLITQAGFLISPKTPPQPTQTPEYLGYRLNFEEQKKIPQKKQIFQLAAAICDLLVSQSEATLLHHLSVRGKLQFLLPKKVPVISTELNIALSMLTREFPALAGSHKGYLILNNLKMGISSKAFDWIEKSLDEMIISLQEVKNNDAGEVKHVIEVFTDSGKEGTGVLIYNLNTETNHVSVYLEKFGKDVIVNNIPSTDSAIHPSSTDTERRGVLQGLEVVSHLPDLPPREVTLIKIYNDNQSLITQLLTGKAKQAKSLNEIEKIKQVLDSLSIDSEFHWKRRTTKEMQLVDHIQHESSTIFTKTGSRIVRKFIGEAENSVHNPFLFSPIPPEQLHNVLPWEGPHVVTPKATALKIPLYFPHTELSIKKYQNIVDFLYNRRAQGYLLLPLMIFQFLNVPFTKITTIKRRHFRHNDKTKSTYREKPRSHLVLVRLCRGSDQE